MKTNKSIVMSVLLVLILIINFQVLAKDLPFEIYKQGVISFENQDWSEADHYFDEIVLNDLSYSDYLAKSIYLKTILLAAEIDKNMELKNIFSIGANEIPFKEKDRREEFALKIDNYQLDAKRKVDTLIGLANYLVANLPPLEINIDIKNNNSWDYNPEWINQIKSGSLLSEAKLEILENGILAEKVKDYLQLTLEAQSFNNLFVVKAEEGDNLYYLSKKYEVPLSLLLKLNSHIENPDMIYPNERIYMPKRNYSTINYPAYFYYTSNISYQANIKRKDDISRLVVKAYQLTNGDMSDINYKDLISEVEIKEYRDKIKMQTEQIRLQDKEIEEIKNKYNQLIKELQKVKDQTENKTNNPGVKDGDYDPTKDPLDY
ncbi:LysM peptidoglycan-binding domain-containing protein [Orenia marismortui]|uniref:LysM peptidoglycan-binding domain-containing protein n=1 Tax=Orenia marismortui TaxID=46469 RepID=UPI000366CD39|nr:LysM peptidoglycan-binding domain-containing protein [Orenia marismortui]